MPAVEAALAAAVDAVLTTRKVTYLRKDVSYPAPTEFGTRYDVVVPLASPHVPGEPTRAAGVPAGAAVLRGGTDLDAPGR